MQTSIKDLKNNLSAYLKMVSHGEELIITSHNQAIAKIIPLIDESKEGKISQSLFLDEIHQLHQQLSKIKLKTTMRDAVLQGRKDERS
jgi:prevent-host-death family protein